MELKAILTGATIGLVLLTILELVDTFIRPVSLNVYVVGYIICLFFGAMMAGMKTIDKGNAWKSGVWIGIVMAIISPFLSTAIPC